MSFQRARSKDQINDRIHEILSAAIEIYEVHGYEGVTFSAISEKTDFTRPTIYKYFSTKEEILLKILSKDIEVWTDELNSSFRLNKIYRTKQIAEIWAHAVSSYKRMNELHSILFTILERNSSKEAIIAFKKTLYDSAYVLHKLVGQLYPNASYEKIVNFLSIQYSLSVGYYPMCHLSMNQLEAMRTISKDYVIPDFEKGYRDALYQIMLALE